MCDEVISTTVDVVGSYDVVAILKDVLQSVGNGVKANVHLLHKDNVHRNRLQVINQYEAEGGSHAPL